MKKIKKKVREYLYKKVAPAYMQKELFDYLPTTMDTFIDIGAHNGSFTKMFTKQVKTTKNILIEPIPEYVAKIKADDFFKKDIVYTAAVSLQEGEAEFEVNELPETSSLLKFDHGMLETRNINKKKERTIKVKLITLKNIILEQKLKEIDFIKIDVQGAELDVLNGIQDEFGKIKRILCEVSFKPLYVGSATFNDIYELMIKNNFILIQLIPVYRGVNDELLQADALFVNKNHL